MKRNLILTLFLFFCAVYSYADSPIASTFNSEDTAVSTELSELTALEAYVNTHPDIALADIKEGNQLASIPSNLLNNMAPPSEKALGIPSFLWGCATGIVGVAVVYFVTEDKDETKKAVWGCVASTAAWTVLYFTVFAVSAVTY